MSTGEPLAYVCEHIFEGTCPVLLVAHESGDWQFLCGADHDPEAIPRVIGMNHIIDTDPSVRDIIDLPDGWEAERGSLDAAWIRTASNPTE